MALVHTLVHSEVVSHLAGGHLRQPDVYDVLLGHTTSLQLLAVQPDGSHVCISRQPAHAVIRDLAVLPWTCSNAGKELMGAAVVLMLTEAGVLSCLAYHSQLCRFVLVQHIVLTDADLFLGRRPPLPGRHGFRLAVRPDGQQVAAALEHDLVALFDRAADKDAPLEEQGSYLHATGPSWVRSPARCGCTLMSWGATLRLTVSRKLVFQHQEEFNLFQWHFCVQTHAYHTARLSAPVHGTRDCTAGDFPADDGLTPAADFAPSCRRAASMLRSRLGAACGSLRTDLQTLDSYAYGDAPLKRRLDIWSMCWLRAGLTPGEEWCLSLLFSTEEVSDGSPVLLIAWLHAPPAMPALSLHGVHGTLRLFFIAVLQAGTAHSILPVPGHPSDLLLLGSESIHRLRDWLGWQKRWHTPGIANQICTSPRIQVATLDDCMLPPGGACWQDTGSQGGAQSLLLPGTGLAFPAMNADPQWKPLKFPEVDEQPPSEHVPSRRAPAMDSDATCTLWLPSGDLLLARPYGGVDRLSAAMLAGPCSEWQAEPMLAQAAPLTSCLTADLAELGHAQVYGVCRGPANQAGSIKVISPACRVDTLMSTDADFEGITGLWSVPAEPSGGSHVLVVLSFLAGSRALTAGTTFSDVTDSVGLCPHETTIFSACIGPAIMVQVTPRRVQLCNVSGLAASAWAADDEDFDSPAGRSRARYDSSLSLAGLDISSPDLECTGTSEQKSPVDVWTPSSGASISAAAAGDGLLIACCSDFKGLMALTAAETGTQSPPGSGHLSGKRKRQQRHWQLHLAGQQALQAEASCLHLVGNHCSPSQPAAADQGPPSALLAVGTYQPAVQLLQVHTDSTHQGVTFVPLASFCLSSLAQHSAAHISSFPPSDQPVSPASPSRSSQIQQTAQTAPETRTSPCMGGSPAAAAAGSLAAAALGEVPAEQDVPESVQLLPQPPGHADCPHLLVGLRSGNLIQLQADHAHTGTLQSLARLSLDQEQQDLMEDGSGSPVSQPMKVEGADGSRCFVQQTRQPGPEAPPGGGDQPMRLRCMLQHRLGLTPVTLVPLPAADGLRSSSLALSDGLSLVGQHAGSGRIQCRLLAVRGVQHVTPLWQPASTMQSSVNSRFTLLCSLEGGRLQLVDVQPQGHPNIRTLPLSVQPTTVVAYRHCGLVRESSLPLLLVLGSQLGGRSEAKESAPLQCLLGIHPTTGDEQLRLTSIFEPGEVPTCICTWQPHWELPTAFVELRQRLAGPVAQLVERAQSQGGRRPAHLDLPPALRHLVGQVAEEGAGMPADAPGSSTLVAVGTSVQGGEAPKAGRLQLLRLRPYCSEVGGQRTTAWDVEVAHVLKFPGTVHAVAQHGDLGLVATVGRRLVRFEPALLRQQERQQTWSPRSLVAGGGMAGGNEAGDEEPGSSCSMLPSAMTVLKVNPSGFILAADEHTSVVMCEGERQRPVASNPHSVSVKDCTFSAAPGGDAVGSAVFAGGAAQGEELPGVAAVTAGGSLVVLTKPAPLGPSWSPESNLTAVLQWSLHEPGVLVQAGSLQNPIAGISTDQYSAVCRCLWHRAGQALEQLRVLGLGEEQGDFTAVSGSKRSQGAPGSPKQAQGQALAHLLRLRQLLCEDDVAAAHARQLGPHNTPGSVQSLTAVTQGGALVECKRLSSAQHVLLLAVQQAAVKAPGLRPLGGLGLVQEKASHAPEALEALDGDYLEQVLDLAATELSELMHDAAQVLAAEGHSLDEVVTLLQAVL